MRNKTISEGYLDQQRELHENPSYGVASLHFSPIIAAFIRQVGCRTVSDYGAGKRRLLEGLGAQGINLEAYYPYDPAFPEYGLPRSADLVCCIDVLEHAEPEFVDAILFDLASIVTHFGFFSVHMGPAKKVLPDGRNAHLIQKPTSWWLKKLCDHFEVGQLHRHDLMGDGFWVIVTPRESHLP